MHNIIIENIASISTCYAAIAASKWIGKGDSYAADKAAVEAMRSKLNSFNIGATIVIGEGERDKAPMLYIGEHVGTLDEDMYDIALDPLECTNICSNGGDNSLSVIAISKKGGLLHAPDLYMNKIAIGSGFPDGIVDLDNDVEVNLSNLAKAKKCQVSDLIVTILDRPRHKDLISRVRKCGARIKLILDGDVSAIIECATEKNRSSDIYIGIGGAPEGVLAAAALKTLGGQMQSRLIYANNHDMERTKNMGFNDLNRKFSIKDMVDNDVIFAATGVTNGSILDGVISTNGLISTHSLIINSYNNYIKYIRTNFIDNSTR